MSAYTLPSKPLPFWQRLLFAVPIFGRIGKEVAYGEEENFSYALFAFFCAWGCSIVLFGLPGLYLPAVALVPLLPPPLDDILSLDNKSGATNPLPLSLRTARYGGGRAVRQA